MKVKQLIKPNVSDLQAAEMKYPNMYKTKNLGKRKRVRREKVVIRDSKTGKVYGRRTVIQHSTS